LSAQLEASTSRKKIDSMDDGLAQLPEGVREGEDLAGKYRIGAILGIGAMGIVVSARHKLLDQKVAIKFLHTDPREQPDGALRFLQEAQSAMSIQSEHVVRIRDVATLETGEPYIIMEYLEGSDLASRLRKTGPFVVREAVDYLLQACEAIAEAHRLGIIHRDLKPANLFLVERPGALPSIKVLDFGISKITEMALRTPELDRATGEITGAKAVMGSPFYMSPEQMESARDVDVRTDIWALGVTLFQLVTGMQPYTGHSIVQVYAKITARGPHPWKQALALSRCPAGLELVIARCLARDRNRRYPSVADLARALKPFGSAQAEVSVLRIKQALAGSGGVQTSTLDPLVLRPIEPSRESRPEVKAPPVPTRRARGGRTILGGLMAAVVAVGIVISFARWRGFEVRRRSAAVAAVDAMAPLERFPSERAWVPVVPSLEALAEQEPAAAKSASLPAAKARAPRAPKAKRVVPGTTSRVVFD
jgi:serine/threonine-protein kinase